MTTIPIPETSLASILSLRTLADIAEKSVPRSTPFVSDYAQVHLRQKLDTFDARLPGKPCDILCNRYAVHAIGEIVRDSVAHEVVGQRVTADPAVELML